MSVLCGICALNEPAHRDAQINHEFSREGKLIPKDGKKGNASHTKANADGPAPVSVEGAGDAGSTTPRSSETESKPSSLGDADAALVPGQSVQSGHRADEATTRALHTLRNSSDPVLRMALIDKGLLTTDDLTAAETKIAAMIGQPIESVFRMRSLGSSQVESEGE